MFGCFGRRILLDRRRCIYGQIRNSARAPPRASRAGTSDNSSNRPLTDEDRAARERYLYERLGAELDLDDRVVQGDERMEYFRKLLRSKDTARILTFMREQRITAGDPLHFGITAICILAFTTMQTLPRS